MMRNIKQNLLLILTLISVMVIATGCGSSSNKQATKDTTVKTKIIVATAALPKPFTFVNDKGDLDGYDIQVVKKIAELLPQYDIQFEKTEFASVLAGLDSGRYMAAANHFVMNEKRKEKYLFSEPIFKEQFGVAVKNGRTDIKTLSDLSGKKTITLAGSNYALALEKYNQAHPDKKILITYSEADLSKTYQDIESGAIDFVLDQGALFHQYQKTFGLNQKFIKLSDEDSNAIGIPYSYLLIQKSATGEQLKKDFDGAIKTLNDNGTLTQISKNFFDGDYAPKSK
jgi:polar amino acid transport system substrate-binding protein